MEQLGVDPDLEPTSGFAASTLQVEIWHLQQACPDPLSNHCLFKVERPVDPARIEAELVRLIAENEILRTRLVTSRLIETPMQVIQDPSSARSLFELEVDASPDPSPDTAAEREFAEITQGRIGLSTHPLRLKLFTHGLDVTFGILSVSSTISDGSTLRNLLRSLFSTVPLSSPAQDSPVQYADLSDWLSERLADGPRGSWIREPKRRRETARTKSALWGIETLEPFRAAGREMGIGLEALLSRSWALYLWNFHRDAECLIAQANDFRKSHSGLQGALGPMETWVACARDVQGQSSLRTFLQNDAVRPAPASASGKPVQTRDLDLFEFRSAEECDTLRACGVSVLGQDVLEPPFRSKLEVAESRDSLSLTLRLPSGELAVMTAELALARFLAYLSELCRDPGARIDELSPLSKDDQHEITTHWNRTQVAFEDGSLRLEKLFEKVVRRSPEARALEFGNQTLTYLELNERANQLARALKTTGLPEGDSVVIVSEPSIDYVVQVLATLKSGATFVPLDPESPKPRIQSILDLLRPKLLLTQSPVPGRPSDAWITPCPKWAGLELAEILSQSRENLQDAGSTHAAAYTIFTSGTTGQPKGVTVSHASLVNFLLWMKSEFPLRPDSKVLQMCSHAFDVSLRELWWPLISGATVVLTEPEVRRDPDRIVAELIQREITDLRLAPSLLSAVLETRRLGAVRSLERVFTGGEPLPPSLERKYHESVRARLLNMYGPTETTVNASYRSCDPSVVRDEISIGRPIANTRIYLLNDELRPVPQGARGELFIGGKGVALGYLGDPILSRSCFMPDPFAHDGGRMYRTGDFGRYLESGEIHFLGRSDLQVKLRGYRIELGEIEATLRSHPRVHDVAVRLIQGAAQTPELTAFLVLEADSAIDAAELRALCLERLPDYMVPSRFVPVPGSLPLTLNGKVDAEALSRIEMPGTPPPTPLEPLESEREGLVISIWKTILGVQTIAPTDNYFNLGGDSIRTIQVVQSLAKFGIRIDPATVFRNPTPRLLARSLGEKGDRNPAPLIDLSATILPASAAAFIPAELEIEDAYPASSMQEVILDHYGDGIPGSGVYHVQQVFNLHDPDGISIEALQTALRRIVDEQPAFRTRFVKTARHSHLQVILPPSETSWTEVDLRNLPEAEHSVRIGKDLQADRERPFPVEGATAPLCRFHLFLRSRNHVSLCRSTHHAITDGWGKSVFFGKMAEVYVGLKSNLSPASRPVAQTGKEFIALELEATADPEARRFWASRLSDLTDTSLERRPHDLATEPTKNIVLLLDPELSLAAQAAAKLHLASIKSVYLTAYHSAVSEMMLDDRIQVGVVSNGRSHRMTHALDSVGLYWNIVPFRPPFRSDDIPGRIRATQAELIAIEPITAFPIREMLEISRRRSLFFATFNFVHFHSVADQQFERISWDLSNLHDKFHYPINLVVSVHPLTGEVTIRIEFDARFFSEDQALELHSRFIAELGRLTRDVREPS